MLSYSDFMKEESRANGDDVAGLTALEIKAKLAAEKAYQSVIDEKNERLERMAIEDECWTGDFRDYD